MTRSAMVLGLVGTVVLGLSVTLLVLVKQANQPSAAPPTSHDDVVAPAPIVTEMPKPSVATPPHTPSPPPVEDPKPAEATPPPALPATVEVGHHHEPPPPPADGEPDKPRPSRHNFPRAKVERKTVAPTPDPPE